MIANARVSLLCLFAACSPVVPAGAGEAADAARLSAASAHDAGAQASVALSQTRLASAEALASATAAAAAAASAHDAGAQASAALSQARLASTEALEAAMAAATAAASAHDAGTQASTALAQCRVASADAALAAGRAHDAGIQASAVLAQCRSALIDALDASVSAAASAAMARDAGAQASAALVQCSLASSAALDASVTAASAALSTALDPVEYSSLAQLTAARPQPPPGARAFVRLPYQPVQLYTASASGWQPPSGPAWLGPQKLLSGLSVDTFTGTRAFVTSGAASMDDSSGATLLVTLPVINLDLATTGLGGRVAADGLAPGWWYLWVVLDDLAPLSDASRQGIMMSREYTLSNVRPKIPARYRFLRLLRCPLYYRGAPYNELRYFSNAGSSESPAIVWNGVDDSPSWELPVGAGLDGGVPLAPAWAYVEGSNFVSALHRVITGFAVVTHDGIGPRGKVRLRTPGLPGNGVPLADVSATHDWVMVPFELPTNSGAQLEYQLDNASVQVKFYATGSHYVGE